MIALLAVLLVGCPRGAVQDTAGQDTARSETCVPATQFDAPNTLGTADAGWSYCWSDDPFAPRWSRTAAPDCAADPAPFVQECLVSDDAQPCAIDDDCIASGEGTQCTNDDGVGCMCVSPCAGPTDCASGETCLCASAYETPGGALISPVNWSQCLPSECVTDHDCSGRACGISEDACQRTVGMFCHTAADTCLWSSDCATNERCLFDREVGAWGCSELADCD